MLSHGPPAAHGRAETLLPGELFWAAVLGLYPWPVLAALVAGPDGARRPSAAEGGLLRALFVHRHEVCRGPKITSNRCFPKVSI